METVNCLYVNKILFIVIVKHFLYNTSDFLAPSHNNYLYLYAIHIVIMNTN